jgi:hypothetical protein
MLSNKRGVSAGLAPRAPLPRATLAVPLLTNAIGVQVRCVQQPTRVFGHSDVGAGSVLHDAGESSSKDPVRGGALFCRAANLARLAGTGAPPPPPSYCLVGSLLEGLLRALVFVCCHVHDVRQSTPGPSAQHKLGTHVGLKWGGHKGRSMCCWVAVTVSTCAIAPPMIGNI